MWDYNFLSKDELHYIVCMNIKKYRRMRGMTQDQLSEKIGISHDHQRQLESQKGDKSFSFYTLFKISQVLDIPIDKFVQSNTDE